jgi:alpha-galactosidase
MGSVYYCADTAAGDLVIHPAFNGLWQFAGPGHWNDPDMLQVGNMPTEIEDRTHFALWCILAAPLMAGNDLRSMSDETRDILCAPEVLAVNQDPRGVQGYKVYDQDDREIYNKPLHDGTTAVLLLNKNAEPADMTVTWDMIGLSGRQPVRDLWQRKDLGRYAESFTTKNLPQHGHRLLKIGARGKPLPTADPVPLKKYAVTQEGITCLSDLYYIWKRGDAPRYDKSFGGKPILMNGTVYDRGFGCKATSKIMFKLNGCADKFKAVIGLDPAYQGDETVSFRLREQDPIGPDSLLYDSGKMDKDTPAKSVEVDVRGIDCLILAVEGKQALCNWADAHVLVGHR